VKNIKSVIPFIFGILVVLLAVACSQALTTPPEEADSTDITGLYADHDDSFNVTFTIGGDDEARTVVGPDASRIIVTGANGLRNYVQLIVLDQGTSPKKVVAFAEQRKAVYDDDVFSLSLENLDRSKTYSFLLLMGNWERTDNGGTYLYNSSAKPTLLAAGIITDKQLNFEGTTTITITMSPLTVDTKFTKSSETIEPKIVNGVPKPAYLTPGQWAINWTIRQSVFEKALIPAQAKAGTTGSALAVKSKKIYLSGVSKESQTGAGVTTSNLITYSIAGNEITNGASKNVYFNLEYVPFNLDNSNAWSGRTSLYFTLPTERPVWIIRNGLNDAVPTANTNFSNNMSHPAANGNGAVKYVVGLAPDLQQSTDLELTGGSFAANLETPSPTVKYNARVSSGQADVWYTVVGPDASPPDIEDYTSWLARVSTGNDLTGQITVGSSFLETGYDVYMRLSQGNKVSAPMVLRARLVGNVLVDWNWGEEELVTVSNMNLTTKLRAPVLGADVPVIVSDDEQYTGGYITWEPAHSTFQPNTDYAATFTLTAEPGYTFEDLAGSFYHTILPGTSVSASNNQGTSIDIQVEFTAIAKIDLTDYVISPYQNVNLSFDDTIFEDNGFSCTGILWQMKFGYYASQWENYGNPHGYDNFQVEIYLTDVSSSGSITATDFYHAYADGVQMLPAYLQPGKYVLIIGFSGFVPGYN
jgi:hypothetical protein